MLKSSGTVTVCVGVSVCIKCSLFEVKKEFDSISTSRHFKHYHKEICRCLLFKNKSFNVHYTCCFMFYFKISFFINSFVLKIQIYLLIILVWHKDRSVRYRVNIESFKNENEIHNKLYRGPQRGIIVSNLVGLDHFRLSPEFDPLWVQRSVGLVPHLSYSIIICIPSIFLNKKSCARWHLLLELLHV